MKNKNPLLVPELRAMVATGDVKALQDFCESGHPATIAELIAPLEAVEALLREKQGVARVVQVKVHARVGERIAPAAIGSASFSRSCSLAPALSSSLQG